MFLTLSLNVTEQKGITCLDITLHTRSTSYNWDLTPCSPSHRSERKAGTIRWRYTQKCCMPNGNYLLLCESSKTHGWMDSIVKIGQHQFCDDYTGYNSIVKLNIRGKHSAII